MRNVMPSKRHSGITLVEVAFAMGIILVGVVGLISIIPVAGRQAREAVSLNNGSALATAGFAQFEARGYMNPNRWVLSTDFSNNTPPFPRQSVLTVPFLESVLGTGPLSINTSAVCIDPLMVASRPGYEAPTYIDFQIQGTNGHRRLRFPYYKANYNPLVSPSENVTTGNQWPPMGRMTRATVSRFASGGGFITEQEAGLLSESGDDVNVFQSSDRSLPAALEGDNVTGVGVGFGRAQTNGKYSWIATINDLPGTDYATVSIVVIEDRDRSFFTYPPTDPASTEPDEHASDERVAYVSFAGGFSGGAGGTVEVQMSATVDPDVSVGEWVMLSRNVYLGAVYQYSLHRWYRVLGVVGEPERVVVQDPVYPSVNREVWQLRMMLDGPDWSFGFVTPGFASVEGTGVIPVRDNTVMTLMRNVVSVTEKTIRKP